MVSFRFHGSNIVNTLRTHDLCQDATQLGLVQIRRRFIDTANKLLDAADLPSIRTASRIIAAHFPTVAKVAVSDERIEYLSDIPDSELEKMRLIRERGAREKRTDRCRRSATHCGAPEAFRPLVTACLEGNSMMVWRRGSL